MKFIGAVLLCLTAIVLVLLWRHNQTPSGATRHSERVVPVAPLTPALSPLRGEGGAHAPTQPSGLAASHSPVANRQSPSNTIEASNSLPPPPNLTWERAATEPAFSRFVEWTHRYRAAATAGEKSVLETEGVALARERLEALAEVIQNDPQHALELTVPLGVRRSLPASVESFLEERVSGRGDLMVLGAF